MSPVRRYGWWFFATALAVFCYWPSLTSEFGVHNDYSLWAYDRTGTVINHPETAHLVAIGRPLGALLLNLHSYPIQTIADFTAWRWCTFVVVLLSAMLLARHLERRVHLPCGLAVCAAVCVFLLPSSQVFVFWVSNFVPGTLNILFALLTYEVLARVPLDGWSAEGWRRAKLVGLLSLAGIFFLASMCIYPSTTLFILVPTFCTLVFSPLESWPQTRRVVLRDASFTFAGCCGYFFLTRFIIRPVFGHYFPAVQNAIEWNQTGAYQLSFEHDVFQLLENFWAILSVSLEGPLYPWLGGWGHARLGLLLAAGLLLVGSGYLIRRRAMSSPSELPASRGYLVQACVAGLALLALSETPWLVSAGANGSWSYRVICPAAAMVFLLLLSVAVRLRMPLATTLPAFIAKPWPALILLACALLGHLNLGHASANAHAELTLFREQLNNLDLRAAKGLLVIGPPKQNNFVGVTLQVEFSKRAIDDSFVQGFADALLAEKGIRRGELVVRHLCFDSAAEYSATVAGTSVIDLNRLASGTPARQRPSATISVSTEMDENSLKAFDGLPRSFWEAGNLPQWVQASYDEPFPLGEYSIVAGRPPECAPLDWQVLGSNDGSDWKVVDQRHGETGWGPNEVRTYVLEKPAHFCQYKLLFTAAPSEIVRINEWTLHRNRGVRVASQPTPEPQ